jgi:TolB-like 6-blade propeller-like
MGRLRVLTFLATLSLLAIARTSAAQPSVRYSRLHVGKLLHAGAHIAIGPAGLTILNPGPMAAPAIAIVSPANGRILGYLGQTGDGRCEFISPLPVQSTRAAAPDSTVEVYLFNPRAFVQLAMRWFADTLGRMQCRSHARPVTLSSSRTIAAIARLSRDTLVAVGEFDRGRLAYFDASGRQLRQAGPLPACPDSVPPNVCQHAYQPQLAVAPDGRHIAVASRNASLLELFSRDGSERVVAQAPTPVTPVYQVARMPDGHKVFASGDDLRFGYIAVAATDSFVYALFSGHLRAEGTEHSTMSSDVHVFDWSGRLVWRIALPLKVYALVADTTGRSLFALTDPRDPELVRFDLAR